MTFEYLVLQVQSARVTFVNGQWIGRVPLEEAIKDTTKGFDGCPQVWEYLQSAGHDGWDLIAAHTAGSSGQEYQLLYMKRER
ncbi:MAG: hypothetical protein QM770_06595 [Tepidisphaeraceae bacterium]